MCKSKQLSKSKIEFPKKTCFEIWIWAGFNTVFKKCAQNIDFGWFGNVRLPLLGCRLPPKPLQAHPTTKNAGSHASAKSRSKGPPKPRLECVSLVSPAPANSQANSLRINWYSDSGSLDPMPQSFAQPWPACWGKLHSSEIPPRFNRTNVRPWSPRKCCPREAARAGRAGAAASGR